MGTTRNTREYATFMFFLKITYALVITQRAHNRAAVKLLKALCDMTRNLILPAEHRELVLSFITS